VTGANEASYEDLAGWYDALYDARGKDYQREAAAILEVAAELGVRPGSVLDVACGTGRHLEAFRARVDAVAGVDAAAAMLAIAADRLGPDVPLTADGFATFDLGRTFDLVTCLFSSIGHVRDADELDVAIERMARHVAPGGALFVEPWLTPDAVNEGHVDLVTARTEAGVVARAASSSIEGDALVLHFAWAVATPAGAHTAEEALRMPLFTADRYLAAVAAAGLVGEWRDEVPALGARRGLLIGRRAGSGRG
jgi:SAM-dependent methyltransferase